MRAIEGGTEGEVLQLDLLTNGFQVSLLKSGTEFALHDFGALGTVGAFW